jgi:hypothetical protein
MPLEDTLHRIEEYLQTLQRKRKDGWDKLQIILSVLLPAAVAFVGHQYAVKMKEAEIVSSQQQATALREVEDSRAKAAQDAQQRQHESQIAIARINSRVGQADLLSKFISDLFHNDAKRREVAIKAVLIAIPDEGASIVSLVAQQAAPSAADPATTATVAQTQTIARTALDDRRISLVEGLVSQSGSARAKAYDELTSRSAPWHTDPKLVDDLLRVARQKIDEKLSVYHVLVTFRDISRATSQPREQDIVALCAEAVAKHPTLNDEANSLKAWLKTKRSG